MSDTSEEKMEELETLKNSSPHDPTPCPVIVLTKDQSRRVLAHSLVVDFHCVQSNQSTKCFDVFWNPVCQGSKFDPTIEGFVLCRVRAIRQLKKSCASFRRLCFVGVKEPEDDHHALLIRWIRENKCASSSFSLSRHLLDVEMPTVKKSLFPTDHKKHMKSGGCHHSHGNVASHNSFTSNSFQCSTQKFSRRPINGSNAAKESLLRACHLINMSPSDLDDALCSMENSQLHTVASEIARGQELLDVGALSGTKGRPISVSGTIFNEAILLWARSVSHGLGACLTLIPKTRFPAAFCCKNAETLIPHTEPDCSCALIRVPTQEVYKHSDCPRAYFAFFLQNRHKLDVSVHLLVGMNVHYNGFLVLHKQVLADINQDFYNVSSCGNRQHFSFARKSIFRNTKSH